MIEVVQCLQVAIKILEKKRMTEEADVVRVFREIQILQRIRHPNIIQLYDVPALTPLL